MHPINLSLRADANGGIDADAATDADTRSAATARGRAHGTVVHVVTSARKGREGARPTSTHLSMRKNGDV
jgi:hypothetical protein